MSEVNGHDVKSLKANLTNYLKSKGDRPSVTICHTIKGKGFYFAENNPKWHHKNSLSNEEIENMNNCLK